MYILICKKAPVLTDHNHDFPAPLMYNLTLLILSSESMNINSSRAMKINAYGRSTKERKERKKSRKKNTDNDIVYLQGWGAIGPEEPISL